MQEPRKDLLECGWIGRQTPRARQKGGMESGWFMVQDDTSPFSPSCCILQLEYIHNSSSLDTITAFPSSSIDTCSISFIRSSCCCFLLSNNLFFA
jgi:hypothetical protein